MRLAATAGPWEVVRDLRGDNVFVGAGEDPVAAVYHRTSRDGQTDERLGNAALIAEAPALLTALTELTSAVRSGRGVTMVGIIDGSPIAEACKAGEAVLRRGGWIT